MQFKKITGACLAAALTVGVVSGCNLTESSKEVKQDNTAKVKK